MRVERRICGKTGLALSSSPVLAFRIARASYGPLDPPLREPHIDPDIGRRNHFASWSRYDTIGRTIYIAADPVVAYMEMLAPYRTVVADERRALQPVADFVGVELKDLWNDIVAEWDEAGTMKASWLPRVFREGREIYMLGMPAGWWIDITASETIAALHELFGDQWPTQEGISRAPLTLSHLTGDDRVLTTAIASKLRDGIELDDGSLPLGIEFISKHGKPQGGTGQCWAYWMRQTDSGLTEPVTIKSASPINDDSPAFNTALDLCKIRAR